LKEKADSMKKALIVLVTVMMTVALLISCGKDPFFHYVDFDSDGGTSVERQIVFDGEKAVKPADPTKEGVKFVDWYDGDTAFDFDTAITGDTVLKAKWSDSGTTPTEKTYTVTYYNGTELVETKTFKENETVTIRDGADLRNGNLAFAGWSTTQGSETADYMADSAYTKNASLTLYAVWSSTITITYKVSGAADVVDEKDVSETVTTRDSSSWTKPTGFEFDGWYTQDKGGGKYFEAGATVTESLVLYAHWIDEDVEVDEDGKVKFNSEKTKTGITSVTIPSVYHGVAITSIAENGFAECSALTEVTFEKAENITSLGMSAFYQCIKLEKIDLSGTNVTELSYTFSGCTSLTEVILPTNLTTMVGGAFYNCSALKSISLPSTLTSISNMAFDHSGLESVTIPKSVKTLETQAFQYCTALKSVTIEGEIKKLENYTFRGCTALESVTLPDTIESIEEDAFKGCGNLSIIINKDKASSTTISGSPWGATSVKAIYSDDIRVTFDSNGGSSVAPVVPDSNGKVTAPTAPTKKGYYFAGWLKEDGTTFFDFNKDTVTEIITLKAKWVESFTVGQRGPAGGIIIYVASTEQTSTYSETEKIQWKYLEAAPTDATDANGNVVKFKWGTASDTFTKRNEIGGGWINTKMISAKSLDNYSAAKACADYSYGGYDDWFLPSYDEAAKIQVNKTAIGNLHTASGDVYWTSSLVDNNSSGKVYTVNLSSSSWYIGEERSVEAYVRPIRAF
jgi:uncharacterized repeat protein (TIGR02543 family)